MLLTAKRLLAAAVVIAAFGGVHAASACTNLAGYTCFKDTDGLKNGKKGTSSGVQYNNANWGTFGWNDRADWFYNAGRSQNNCLYTGTSRTGSKVLLKRGQYLYTSGPSIPVSQVIVNSTFRNSVSSNAWTNATLTANCPR